MYSDTEYSQNKFYIENGTIRNYTELIPVSKTDFFTILLIFFITIFFLSNNRDRK